MHHYRPVSKSFISSSSIKLLGCQYQQKGEGFEKWPVVIVQSVPHNQMNLFLLCYCHIFTKKSSQWYQPEAVVQRKKSLSVKRWKQQYNIILMQQWRKWKWWKWPTNQHELKILDIKLKTYHMASKTGCFCVDDAWLYNRSKAAQQSWKGSTTSIYMDYFIFGPRIDGKKPVWNNRELFLSLSKWNITASTIYFYFHFFYYI